MPRGESGRIVIDVEPEFKRRLYSALAISGSTLKDWFIKSAADYCDQVHQPSLFQTVTPAEKKPTKKAPSQNST